MYGQDDIAYNFRWIPQERCHTILYGFEIEKNMILPKRHCENRRLREMPVIVEERVGKHC
jgi:hypothetical protein